MFYFNEEQSLNLKFIFIIYSLLRLEKNGNLIITYGDISTIQSYQIINNLIPYFEEIIIYDQETKIKYKQTGTDVYCRKFKNNFDIKKFESLIYKIFKYDPTLGNEFLLINKKNNSGNDNDDYENVNIYINDYSINKSLNEKLLNDIKKVNYKKHFLLTKMYYDVIFTLKKLKNDDYIEDSIKKYNESIRIIKSYKKGVELDLIKSTVSLDSYVEQEIIKLRKNTILTKNIAIYKEIKIRFSKRKIKY
jgi:hypothetical protein